MSALRGKWAPGRCSCLLGLGWDQAKPWLRSYFIAKSPAFPFLKNRIVTHMETLREMANISDHHHCSWKQAICNECSRHVFGFKRKGEEKHAAQGSNWDCLPLNTTAISSGLLKTKHVNLLPHILQIQQHAPGEYWFIFYGQRHLTHTSDNSGSVGRLFLKCLFSNWPCGGAWPNVFSVWMPPQTSLLPYQKETMG